MSRDYDGLQGALCVLYQTVRRGAELNAVGDGTFRVTIHRIAWPAKKGAGAEELEQLLPYIGGAGGAPGRKFSIRAGGVGKAAREKRAVVVRRESEVYPDFVRELVRSWSYTEEEARAVSSDRHAWMAVPILGADLAVAAVVYLDSSLPEFFTPNIQRLVGNACSGVATYIVETY